MNGDPIGVPGCESRAEPPCTVGAAARHSPRLQRWLTEVLRLKSTILTTAAPFYDTNTIEPFSSRGPTPDGRTKPDVVGVDCAASVAYGFFIRRDSGRGCWFPGTSQASPHVAGMAALVRQRFPERTLQQVAAYLKDNAEARGAVPNNTWGHGFAQLPATAAGGCDHELTADGTTSGQWSARCQSAMLGRGYAQYYSFNLEGDTQVTIDLESRLDPYLFLRAGEARSGNFLLENDDVEAGANTNSRITTTLAAGTYTIEATTYYAEETGSFTLTIADLVDGSGDSGATPDDCGATIGAEATISGTWSSVCQSAESNRGYARYYTFTVDQQSQVTIDLVSSLDTYLYLRSGHFRYGTVLHENDDAVPGTNTNSRISESLGAGTYTIEATTYSADQAGAFTLARVATERKRLDRKPALTSALRPSPGTGPSKACGPPVAGPRSPAGATPGIIPSTWLGNRT